MPTRETLAAQVLHGPVHISFLPGDRCNATCIMCPHSGARVNHTRQRWPELDVQVVKDVLQRHRGSLQSVEFAGFGEPLLNPDMHEIFKAVAANGVSLNLITNGTQLPMFATELATTGGWLTTSIDSPDVNQYAQIRRGLDLSCVVAGIKSIIRHPRRIDTRRVGINMTIWELNVEQIFATATFAVSVGVDYLTIQRAVDFAITADTELCAVKADDVRVLKQITSIQQTYPGLELLNYFNAESAVGPTVDGIRICDHLWDRFTIDPKGRCHTCCFDCLLPTWTDIGSVNDVWMGEPISTLREQILSGDVDANRFPTCAKCSYRGKSR